MEALIHQLYKSLHRLIGLHRQLLEAVRAEKDALLNVNAKAIEESVYTKEVIVNSIKQAESERIRIVGALAKLMETAEEELSLEKIIIIVQGKDLKVADQFRSALSALRILVQRITEQNKDNQKLVDNTIGHIQNMKMNILGTTHKNEQTYNVHGKKHVPSSEGKLISKEA